MNWFYGDLVFWGIAYALIFACSALNGLSAHTLPSPMCLLLMPLSLTLSLLTVVRFAEARSVQVALWSPLVRCWAARWVGYAIAVLIWGGLCMAGFWREFGPSLAEALILAACVAASVRTIFVIRSDVTALRRDGKHAV